MPKEKVHFISSDPAQELHDVQDALKSHGSRIFVVIDDVFNHLPKPSSFTFFIENNKNLKLSCGENGKTLVQAQILWSWLSENSVEKTDFVWFIGGGTLCDLGGFCSSTFKRGIPFGFIPTTLLAMVDASIGGKNGINFNQIKNNIGTFQHPHKVVIEPRWLETLPEYELFNGWMELCKHGLIGDATLWDELINIQPKPGQWDFTELISKGIAVKSQVVERDFLDHGERKKLNFGHTVGHAIESMSLKYGHRIGHGIAIGWGMIVALEWSMSDRNLPHDHPMKQAQSWLRKILVSDGVANDLEHIKEFEMGELWAFMAHDKKNSNHHVLDVKLLDIGKAKWDEPLDFESFQKAWKKAFD